MAAAADPITAIAQAAGDLFKGVGDIWSSINNKKIVRQEGVNLDKLTAQERIKYDELVTSGNFTMASNLLAGKESEAKASQINTYIIIGFTFLIVMVIIYIKNKK